VNHKFYQTSQFARKASVSVRTLRYYDKVGLFSPSGRTEAGYRLYTDADLVCLQRILALKFLGFSLEEIRYCLQVGPKKLQTSLAQQRAMMREKRMQLDAVIHALDETAALLCANEHDWDAIVKVIRVIHMQETNDWRKKYFSDEQLQQIEALSKKYYTQEQRQQLAEWGKGWSEQDQLVANQRWAALTAELQRLVDVGADPASMEAQALAAQWQNLVREFTRGDPGIQKSLNKLWEDVGKAAPGESPYPMPYSKEGGEFIKQALKLLNEKSPA
jgi:DNA-binding transcriptional MerR regulator